MTHEPKFWNGHRDFHVQEVMELDTPFARDFKAAARAYYRFFNDGDTMHHAKFERLCKVAGMVRRADDRTDPETLDDLVEALLDRALDAARAA